MEMYSMGCFAILRGKGKNKNNGNVDKELIGRVLVQRKNKRGDL